MFTFSHSTRNCIACLRNAASPQRSAVPPTPVRRSGSFAFRSLLTSSVTASTLFTQMPTPSGSGIPGPSSRRLKSTFPVRREPFGPSTSPGDGVSSPAVAFFMQKVMFVRKHFSTTSCHTQLQRAMTRFPSTVCSSPTRPSGIYRPTGSISSRTTALSFPAMPQLLSAARRKMGFR